MKNPQNTSSAESGSFDKSLNTDNQGFAQSPNQWVQARNASNNTVEGDILQLSNEASNRFCAAVKEGYSVIGAIHAGGDKWAIYSTNNTDSEIGIYDESECDYKELVNDPCLNFNTKNLITGTSKESFDCTRQLYWSDGRRNPNRTLNIDNIPWVKTAVPVSGNTDCIEYEVAEPKVLDCDKIRLAPLYNNLSFEIKEGTQAGEVLNGSYYVVGGYVKNGVRVTDWSLPSNVAGLFKHANVGSSLEITLVDVDEDYDEYELILVQFANFQNLDYYVIGTYDTRQTKITLTSINNNLARLSKEEAQDIIIRNPIVDKSDALYKAGDYNMLAGPEYKFDFNYQPLANEITSNWVSVEYDPDYYRNGGTNTGYMRDEVYPFFIRWVYNTGDKSPSFHIPGRAPITASNFDLFGNNVSETDLTAGDDAFETTQQRVWQVHNTARVDALSTLAANQYTLPDGGVVIGKGKMGYWESTETYDDDNSTVWADLCGKPIRHHKFPDNATHKTGNIVTNHYDPNNGEKIRILGIEFKNIKPPVDNNGDLIKNVVGYELLRGSREGNRTVFAKGMINNMREYWLEDIDNDWQGVDLGHGSPNNIALNPIDPATGQQYNTPGSIIDSDGRRKLYPNYPYNPLYNEAYLSSRPTTNNAGSNFNNDGSVPEDEEPTEGGDYVSAKPYKGFEYNSSSENWTIDGHSDIKRDFFTFHSPETNFRNPYLSAKEIKIYGEVNGNMRGTFEVPDGHPKHKFLSDLALITSTLIGVGFTIVKTMGKGSVKTSGIGTDIGGGYSQAGVSTGSTFLGYAPIAAGAAGGTAAQVATNQLLRQTGWFSTIVGFNPNLVSDNAYQVTRGIASAAGATGGETEYSREMSEWEAVPDWLRIIAGLPSFMIMLGNGIQDYYDIIRSFTSYKHYALQQVSHSFYDKFRIPRTQNTRRKINTASYIDDELQDFDNLYRINNLMRVRSVALNTEGIIENPKTRDLSQQILSSAFKDKNGNPVNLDQGKVDWNAYIGQTFQQPTASHYVALKQRIDNQYGQIPTIIQLPISTGTKYNNQVISTSDVMFNGDTYIGRYTEKNTMYFFYEWLKGQPNGTEVDYRKYRNVSHPKFWMDSDPFDVNEFTSSIGTIFKDNSNDPQPPGSFDFFLNANDPNANECECDLNTGVLSFSNPSNESACKLTECNSIDGDDLADICEAQFNITADANYLNFLEDALSSMQDQFEEDCDNTGVVIDNTPYTAASLQSTSSPYYPCPDCVDLQLGNNPIDVSNVDGNGWKLKDCGNDNPGDPKSKWNRNLRRAERDVGKSTKKYNKVANKVYEKYLDCQDPEGDSSWFQELFDNVVTPNKKFAFDRKGLGLNFGIKNAFMYLFNSGIRDFYVESEVNVDYRDWGDKLSEQHFDYRRFSNLQTIFNTDRIREGNFFKYDYSLSHSKLFTGFTSWGNTQLRDYDPTVSEKCYVHRPDRLMYSMKRSDENKNDFWRIYLPNNYKDFPSPVSNIKTIGANGVLITFKSHSPVSFAAVDNLKLDSGTKITIGDGELFSQPIQNLVNAETPYEYGACQDGLSVINTPVGTYYMSQNQGKIYQVSGKGLKEISNLGLKWWFAKYLPYQLTKDFPEFSLLGNPVAGIGCQAIFDNENQILYFTKKDYAVRDNVTLKWNEDLKTFTTGVTNTPIELGNPTFFEDASWTISFDPKYNSWISYHDWHPDYLLPSKNTFMSVKDNGIWKHNDRCDSYCNFYNENYPFEIEFAMHSKTQVFTLRNLLYFLEVYKYANNCDDRFHVLDANFDEAIVFNSEQCSGLLNLILAPKNDPAGLLEYPKLNANGVSFDILFHKEEQKYRFNQFSDITNIRGEFDPNVQQTIFDTQANGYVKDLNNNNLDYTKDPFQRKKFRHLKNSLLLRKKVSGNENMIISVAIQMNLKSSR